MKANTRESSATRSLVVGSWVRKVPGPIRVPAPSRNRTGLRQRHAQRIPGRVSTADIEHLEEVVSSASRPFVGRVPPLFGERRGAPVPSDRARPGYRASTSRANSTAWLASSLATPGSRVVAGSFRIESRLPRRQDRRPGEETASERTRFDLRARRLAWPTYGFGLGSHTPTQGFTISTPMSSKSRTLRVASLMRPAIAMAAIWQSAEATGRPAERRAAAIWP